MEWGLRPRGTGILRINFTHFSLLPTSDWNRLSFTYVLRSLIYSLRAHHESHGRLTCTVVAKAGMIPAVGYREGQKHFREGQRTNQSKCTSSSLVGEPRKKVGGVLAAWCGVH